MAYWQLQNDRATYAVDWEIVHRLLRDYNRAQLRDQYSKVSTTSDSHWYNPFSWSMPDIRSLEVDWDKVRDKSVAATDQDFDDLARRATRDVPALYEELRWRVKRTAESNSAFTDRLASMQSDNMSRINAAVDDYQGHIELAKFVRDTSADGLMVGASILSGGAGFAVLGAGSSLKGVAKYEDTGKTGAAVMTGVGSFTFGIFKIGGKELGLGEEAALTIIQAGWQTDTTLAEGKSFGQAAAEGGLTLTGPFVDRFFKLGPVKKLLEKACAPIAITVGSQAKNVAPEFVAGVLGARVQSQIEDAGKALLEARAARAPAQDRRSKVLDSATLGKEALLTLAIVNMSKGIGRGL